MLKKLLFSVLFIGSLSLFSQEETVKDTLVTDPSQVVVLQGQVISFQTKDVLRGAHLYNLNSVIGTITDYEGRFEIPTVANDTVYISFLGYQSIKLKITNDLLKGNELVIELHEKAEQIDEVVVKSHKLIGVLEIDAKNIPEDKFARIHINGISQTYEVGAKRAKTYNSAIDALFRPIDFLYNRFGKKPKELRKLKKLKEDKDLRALLEDKFDRELMMEYLDMDAEELTELLNECNYSDYFIGQASDLQLIEAVLLCYDKYKAIKTGSTMKTQEN